MSDVRRYTNLLLEMVDEGLLDKDNVIMACVKYMSEDDVQDMMEHNELVRPDELDEE
tara:strand:+ start:954 stop:1124 length:171 start_codon:yes stop_codon:yes gene_type:complete